MTENEFDQVTEAQPGRSPIALASLSRTTDRNHMHNENSPMLNSSSVDTGSQPANHHTLTVLDAQPVPERTPSADLRNLLGNGSLRVKEERAFIQRRTVESAVPQAPPSPANLCADVISAPANVAPPASAGNPR